MINVATFPVRHFTGRQQDIILLLRTQARLVVPATPSHGEIIGSPAGGIRIQSLEREDGSGHNWNYTGYFVPADGGASPFAVKGFFNESTGRGFWQNSPRPFEPKAKRPHLQVDAD